MAWVTAVDRANRVVAVARVAMSDRAGLVERWGVFFMFRSVGNRFWLRAIVNQGAASLRTSALGLVTPIKSSDVVQVDWAKVEVKGAISRPGCFMRLDDLHLANLSSFRIRPHVA